jgi:DNA polymerase I-like protein with 3'-5' exonuclease and polymerase domains
MGVLGPVCRTRQAAKRFIYALLLGAGIGKLGEILEANREDTVLALNRILERYTGFAHLKDNVFPRDIRRGWFEGLDGRKVSIPNVQEKPHLVMSGYLQNGESIIMKKATMEWMETLDDVEYLLGNMDNVSRFYNNRNYLLVDLVHDEWQVECPNNMDIAIKIGQAQCDALRKVGQDLNLKCPLAGSFFNKKKNDYTIATNWRLTH